MDKERINEAVECFGEAIVAEVVEIVSMSDADGAYTTFEDMGMFEHAECVELLYFAE